MYLLLEDPSEYSEKNKSEQPPAGGGGAVAHEPQSSKQFGGTMVSIGPTSTILLV